MTIARGMVRFNGEAHRFEVQFRVPFPHALKDRVKAIAGTRWHHPSKHWHVPESECEALLLALSGHIFDLDDDSRARFTAAAGEDASVLAASAQADHLVASAQAVLPIAREAAAYHARRCEEPQSVSDVSTTDANHGSLSYNQETLTLKAVPSRAQLLVDSTPTQFVYPSVLELMNRAKYAMQQAFESQQWVVGVVHDVTHSRRGHLYVSLADIHPDVGPDQAMLQVVVFASHAQRILQELQDNHLVLEVGMTIALAGQLTVYPQRSQLQLVASHVDVRVSRGEVELQRDRVIEALQKAKLIAKNEALELPVLPERIAILTSAHGEAVHDVLRTLRRGQVGASLRLFDVPVQGPQLEAGVLQALAAVELQRDQLDLVLIVRGGGAANELGWWDNLAVATAIAELSLPVLLGIGHERDASALHHVARYEATPTAVAQSVADQWAGARYQVERQSVRLRQNARRVQQRAQELLVHASHTFAMVVHQPITHATWNVHHVLPQQIMSAVSRSVRTQQQQLDALQQELVRQTERHLQGAQDRIIDCQRQLCTTMREQGVDKEHHQLVQLQQQLLHKVQTRIAREQKEIHWFERAIRASDPQRWLERGYALLRNEQGQVIRNVATVDTGETIHVQLADGALTATVSSRTPHPLTHVGSSVPGSSSQEPSS